MSAVRRREIGVKAAPHTLTVFDEELEQLRALVCEMGGRVEASVADAVAALVQGDSARAAAVVADDARIDALAAQVERTSVHLIALRSPLADDLREVMAAFKIAGLLARMGDCAKTVALQVESLGDCRGLAQLKTLAAMGGEAAAMVKAALDAFAHRDAAAAAGVAALDDAVDRYRGCISHALIALMAEDPRSITAATHLMAATQKLERIGDHAVGIAEMVRFAAGEDMGE
jgi:phosphate transport system protein